MRHDRGCRDLHDGPIEPRLWYQQDGLIPVMSLPGILAEEARLNRQQRMIAAFEISFGRSIAFLRFVARNSRLLLQRLVAENVTWLDQQTCLTGAADQLQRDDGVSAELKEIVAGANNGLTKSGRGRVVRWLQLVSILPLRQ